MTRRGGTTGRKVEYGLSHLKELVLSLVLLVLKGHIVAVNFLVTNIQQYII